MGKSDCHIRGVTGNPSGVGESMETWMALVEVRGKSWDIGRSFCWWEGGRLVVFVDLLGVEGTLKIGGFPFEGADDIQGVWQD